MALFQLAKIDAQTDLAAHVPMCLPRIHTALLLSLLHKGLLTQWQFEQCIKELGYHDISP